MTEEDCLSFLAKIEIPKLSGIESNKCDGYLSVEECFVALEKLGNSKSPGNDGLTKEFYITFWTKLGPLLVDCLNESFDKGILATSQRQAVITMIEKSEKDTRFLKNWRPISLINVDVKICSRALSCRLVEVLPNIIHPNQAAYVKDRNIDEPIRFIEDLIDLTVSEQESLLLFAADFEKAFDSIEHNFIWTTLKHFGFGQGFIKGIRILLRNSQSCVLNNGTVIEFFDNKRGTKQGDPISPYIFILVIEIMATMIRNSKEIKGFSLSEFVAKIILYADDTTFFLKDLDSLTKVLEILKLFSRYSSLKINLEKSEIGWLGPNIPHTAIHPAQKTPKVDKLSPIWSQNIGNVLLTQ